MRSTLLLLGVVSLSAVLAAQIKHSRGHHHSSHAELVVECKEQQARTDGYG